MNATFVHCPHHPEHLLQQQPAVFVCMRCHCVMDLPVVPISTHAAVLEVHNRLAREVGTLAVLSTEVLSAVRLGDTEKAEHMILDALKQLGWKDPATGEDPL
jgi:restriction endonuclease Mrr